MRVRRHCENHDDHVQPLIAFQPQFAWRNDRDRQPNDGECARGEFVSVHGDGEREFEYGCELEREWNRGWVGGARDDYREWKLHGAGDAAEPKCFDDHGDERGGELGERV